MLSHYIRQYYTHLSHSWSLCIRLLICLPVDPCVSDYSPVSQLVPVYPTTHLSHSWSLCIRLLTCLTVGPCVSDYSPVSQFIPVYPTTHLSHSWSLCIRLSRCRSRRCLGSHTLLRWRTGHFHIRPCLHI